VKCPDCDVDLVPLVAGINQCPKCKKIIKSKEEKKEEKSEEQTFESGEWFMQHTSINRKYEIAEKGIIFVKNNKENIAAVICHTPEMPTIKYVRLHGFKETANLHHGMIKINEKAELQNLIKILGMFNEDFDEDFNLIKKNKSKIKQENENTKKTLDTDLFFTFDRKKCPNCGSKVKKSQNSKYYSCDACGEIVVMEDGNPIFDIPTDKLPLEYSSNFPVNFYIPVTV
jgi:ribosomal protein L37AE/L43A